MGKKRNSDVVYVEVVVADKPMIILTQEQLAAHDPAQSAYLLVPPSLVYPLFLLFDCLDKPDLQGDFARAVELLLNTWEGGALPDRCSAGQQMVAVMERLGLL